MVGRRGFCDIVEDGCIIFLLGKGTGDYLSMYDRTTEYSLVK